MKFAICNETFLDWSLDRAFAFAAECGYTGIEIAPFTLGPSAGEIPSARRSEVVRLASAARLDVIGLHWLLAKTQGIHLTSPDATIRRRTAEYLTDLAHLCRDLGGSLMVLGSPQQRNLAPGVSAADGMRYAADVIRDALAALEETEIILAIEPLGPADGNFLLTAAEGRQLVEMIDSKNVRLHLDCKAMASEAMPLPELIRRHRGEFVHFHANDPNRQGPGFGELRFEPILAALDETGYEGWVSVEVFDYSPGIERLARQSIDYLRDCQRRLGTKSV
jgi:sugar phosphate isomerase/epimerase